ncbi:hypothetical protein TWF718_009301 [Orbilia javanica]|uniref:Uncharacterized protein n=1 Tax=Orbilia javanica TaxID=47235 RepID=A0AAN8MRH6_9PEZI
MWFDIDIKFSYRYLFTIHIIGLVAHTAYPIPLSTIRSVDIKDLSAYTTINRARIEALWDSLVDFQTAIQSHPIGLDSEQSSGPLNLGQNIFGAVSIFAENDSKPLPTLLGLIAGAKAHIKSLVNEISELGVESPLIKNALGFDKTVLGVGDQQSVSMSLNNAILDITESRNPAPLNAIENRDQNLADLNAGFLDSAEEDASVDLDANPNDQGILDALIDPAPPFDIVGEITKALEALYSTLTAIGDLKADVQPDFFAHRKNWQLDEFSVGVWKTLDSYYRRIKSLQDKCMQEKCKFKKRLTQWVFDWRAQGPITAEYQGVIDLGSKLDLEEGNMDLAVAINDAMEIYEQTLYKAFELMFSDVREKPKNAKMEGFREELMMIYNYMAAYEGNLRQVTASIKVLDSDWGKL